MPLRLACAGRVRVTADYMFLGWGEQYDGFYLHNVIHILFRRTLAE